MIEFVHAYFEALAVSAATATGTVVYVLRRYLPVRRSRYDALLCELEETRNELSAASEENVKYLRKIYELTDTSRHQEKVKK